MLDLRRKFVCAILGGSWIGRPSDFRGCQRPVIQGAFALADAMLDVRGRDEEDLDDIALSIVSSKWLTDELADHEPLNTHEVAKLAYETAKLVVIYDKENPSG